MASTNDILTHFSFSQQESEIYLAVLSLGSAKVTEIARKVGKNRTAVYFHIENLVKRGVLKQLKTGRVLKFSPVPPKELAERFDFWTTEFKSQLPQLEALHHIEQEKPGIEISESRTGYLKIYEEISSLPEGAMFRVLEGKQALESELQQLSESEWQIFFKRIISRKIQTKGLWTEESLTIPRKKLSAQNTTELQKRIWHVRSMPQAQLPFNDLIIIYGNTVAIIFPKTSLVVTIKHSGITQALTTVFDTLFIFAQPVKNAWQ